jgi:dihydroxyacetone kinase DhaKLM complex PTS-EIIA-like component DhaM
MNKRVGIVIVSHSVDIAKGTADMVRNMVGSAYLGLLRW